MPPPSPYAKARLVREKGIATDEFAYLKSVVSKGVPKITIPSPTVMHFFPRPARCRQRGLSGHRSLLQPT